MRAGFVVFRPAMLLHNDQYNAFPPAEYEAFGTGVTIAGIHPAFTMRLMIVCAVAIRVATEGGVADTKSCSNNRRNTIAIEPETDDEAVINAGTLPEIDAEVAAEDDHTPSLYATPETVVENDGAIRGSPIARIIHLIGPARAVVDVFNSHAVFSLPHMR